jgi:signal transduction histidine kinase
MKYFVTFVVLGSLLVLAPVAWAQEQGTPAEAKQMALEAIAHVKDVGAQQAFADFTAPGGKFHNKDLYVFCYKMDGTCVAQGANKATIGMNLIDMKTADGKYFLKEMVSVTQSKGAGWVDYMWPNPLTKKTAAKRSWVEKAPGFDGFCGVGAYAK